MQIMKILSNLHHVMLRCRIRKGDTYNFFHAQDSRFIGSNVVKSRCIKTLELMAEKGHKRVDMQSNGFHLKF